nr:NAD-dependent epimerase/dehydratase family protein [Candidatus Nitrosotenuis chungbukensis]
MTSVIVTGGSGFIGHAIVKKLEKNYNMTIFDIKKRNSETNFIQGDIKDSKLVENSIKNCDYVIHLAATLGVVNTEKNPVLTLDTNLGGTKNVLEACRLNDVKKIIFPHHLKFMVSH